MMFETRSSRARVVRRRSWSEFRSWQLSLDLAFSSFEAREKMVLAFVRSWFPVLAVLLQIFAVHVATSAYRYHLEDYVS